MVNRIELVRKPYIRAIVTDKDNLKFAYDVRLRGGGPEIGMNGTFYWWEDEKRTKRYTDAILIDNGKHVGVASTHQDTLHKPDSVLILDDLSVERAMYSHELQGVKNAISGCGLSRDIYDPILEGYTGAYGDVWRWTYHNIIATKKDRVWLLCVLKGIRNKHNYLKDIGNEFDHAILLDGGHAGALTTPKWGYGSRTFVSQNAIIIKER